MKVINDTRYNSGVLREIVRRVSHDELDAEQRGAMLVRFVEASRGKTKRGYMGICYGPTLIHVVLSPNPVKNCVLEVAKVLAHEFAHARGMTHDQMRGNIKYDWNARTSTGATWVDAVRWKGWAKGLAITVAEKRPKPKMGPEEKLAHARAYIEKWEAKKQRAEAALRNWRTKARYYERVLAKGPAAADGRKP